MLSVTIPEKPAAVNRLFPDGAGKGGLECLRGKLTTPGKHGINRDTGWRTGTAIAVIRAKAYAIVRGRELS